MYINTTYEIEFDDLLMHLKAKYPKELFNLDGIGDQLDMSKFSKKFFSSKITSDASIDANANVDDISVIAYNTEVYKPYSRINSYYVLWKNLRKLEGLSYANKIIEDNISGSIYINDLHGIAAALPYCFNYSTFDIMNKGLPMVNRVISIKPKHLFSFKSQLEQFTVVASNSTLGATGLADMLIVMSYYFNKILHNGNDSGFFFDGWFSDSEKELIIDEIESIANLDTERDVILIKEICDKLNKKFNRTSPSNPKWFKINVTRYIQESIASFIYTINQPMRANQSPFTNVSIFDENFLNTMKENYIFPDGSTFDIELVKELQNIYLRIMNKEMERTPLTFPITTACFDIDEEKNIKDLKFLRFICQQNQKFGFINLYCGNSSTLSSCCRLRSEQKSEYFNSFGAGSSKIGSLGVVTINLPRLAFTYKDNEEEFLVALKEKVIDCSKINNAKRVIVNGRIKNGNEPLYTHGFMDISKQYSTSGVNGIYEAIEELGYDLRTQEGIDFQLKVMKIINDTNNDMQKIYNSPHNCEQIPGENVSIKLASKDTLLKYQDKYEIYSNQFIPLTSNANMLDRIKLQGIFDEHFSGGSILHLNIEEPIDDIDTLMNLTIYCAKMGVVYHAINLFLSQCENNHMTVGKKDNEVCSICGEPIKNKYTRVVGFLTNVKNWHKIRREKDFPNRKCYKKKDLNIK